MPKPKKYIHGRTGRKTLLTPELQQLICDEIKRHGLIYAAAARAGIARQTIFDWLKKGGEKKAKIYIDFSDAVKEALEEFKRENVIRIVKAASDGTWQAAAWILERKFRDEFALRREIELSGNPERPITVKDLARLPDSELAKLAGYEGEDDPDEDGRS